MKKRGLIFAKDKSKGISLINLNFESLVFLALFSFTIVILFAPDYESKQLFGEIVDTLFKGFLGYVTRIAYENYSTVNQNLEPYINEGINSGNEWINEEKFDYNRDDLLVQKQQLENELSQINNKL